MAEGILSQVSIGVEATPGTKVTPSFSIPLLPSNGVVTEQDAVGVEAINTDPALNKDFVQGTREYNGSFSMNAYPVSLGYIFTSALGTPTSDEYQSETSVFKHLFKEGVQKNSLTLEQKIGDITERFAGFTVSDFSIELAVGEPVKISWNGKALGVSEDTAITPTYETSKVFDWTDIVSITLDGVDIKCALQSLSLEYKNNLKSFHGLCGTADPSSLYLEPSEVAGSISAYLNDQIKNLKTAFKDKSTKSLVITIVANDTIGNGSNNSLIITLPKVALNTYTHPIDTSYVAVESDFVGASLAGTGQIEVELVNLQERYVITS